jgi:S1-C subfamily serine protease
MTSLLALLLAVAAAPGWLGIGYLYETSKETRPLRGWMYVQQLDPAGPAAKAGLRPRDLITHLDGRPFTAADDASIVRFLRNLRPGQKVKLSVRRGEATMQIWVVAARMTAEQERRWAKNFDRKR